MSARSAQRTRWRRWRMGRDIAGRKDRDGRMSGCEPQLVGGGTLRIGGQLLLLLLFCEANLFIHRVQYILHYILDRTDRTNRTNRTE